MEKSNTLEDVYSMEETLHKLHHYLPAQAPLKDFVHHNTLHAFQHLPFHEALRDAATSFGYKTYLSLNEYRRYYQQGRISDTVLKRVISARHRFENVQPWKERLLKGNYNEENDPVIGRLRGLWKKKFGLNPDTLIHPLLFRLLGGFLDQGIAIYPFPLADMDFLEALRLLDKESLSGLFRSERVRSIFHNREAQTEDLLRDIVGDYPHAWERYLFDQQFAHQGWSGMVATVERQPENLLRNRRITLKELIFLELCLELDVLETKLGAKHPVLLDKEEPSGDFPVHSGSNELYEVYLLWQEAFEWSYYDQVLRGLQLEKPVEMSRSTPRFQAMFCIDDRECSLRRYTEMMEPDCATFGTPGFFGVEFYFQAEGASAYTKLCPAPVYPKYLIREKGAGRKNSRDLHFSPDSHSFVKGWVLSQTLGFWSGIKLLSHLVKPTMTEGATSSLSHCSVNSTLEIEFTGEHTPEGLQVGYTPVEMADRVEGVLKSIGLRDHFAPLVYVIGHGASSVNNPHYSAYDCGACSGRAGSVNSRVFAWMANHPEVREILRQREIDIPDETRFVAALHDTTRDEMVFYKESMDENHRKEHAEIELLFSRALDLNAKERSRRFELINSARKASDIHKKVMDRSVSLFETRPELNHATNAVCIIGQRYLSKGLFLDRRSFLNSYHYLSDPDGSWLKRIIAAAAPVCGGINLEYYFSRVDNHKLGAGSKLPHNVMGLIGVANGADGDLRPGLPSQMIEVHDPVRLLMVVEQYTEVVKEVITSTPALEEWFTNQWIHLCVIHPVNRNIYRWRNGNFHLHDLTVEQLERVKDIEPILEKSLENLPVYLIEN